MRGDEKVIAGAMAMRVLAFAELVDAFTGTCGAIIDMTGLNKMKVANSVIQLVLAITVNILLIPRYGLMGAAIVLFWKYRGELLVRDKRIGVVIGGWALMTLLAGLMVPMIDNAAHLGGLIGGAVAAWGVRPKILRRRVVYMSNRLR